MSGLETHMHHDPCDNCRHGRCHHDRERVYTDNGRYHYEYTNCPTGSGVYR